MITIEDLIDNNRNYYSMQPQYEDLKSRLLEIARRDEDEIIDHMDELRLAFPASVEFSNISGLTTQELQMIIDDFTLETREDFHRLLTIINLIRIVDYRVVYYRDDDDREFATRELKYIKEAISLLRRRHRLHF